MDHTLIDSLLNDIEDGDDSETGKAALKAVPDEIPAEAQGDDSKLQELVASLSPEEKAKLKALLDADATAPVPDKGDAPEGE